MSSGTYQLFGRSGAGSLIAEFLFCEMGVDYHIKFVDRHDRTVKDLILFHPQGKIPVLICPDQNVIFETLAIVNHITDRFNGLIPARGTKLYDRYFQFLSLMATSIYPAYHRQHHSQYYINKKSYDDLKSRAQAEQSVIYDYLEQELKPYICGELLTAADFYLYMLLRWDLNKDVLYKTRPKLRFFSDMMRKRPSVMTVLAGQPK